MKKAVLLIILSVILLILVLSCGKPYIQLYDPYTEQEWVTLHGAHISPGIIGGKGSSVYIDYTVNKPLGDMTFQFTIMQVCGGLHDFSWPLNMEKLSDTSGILWLSSYYITNDWKQKKVTAHGYGRIGTGLVGKFVDEKGEKQKGKLSNYITIPVEYD